MFCRKNKDKKFKCSRLLEGDEIESRLPFKIFSTLITQIFAFETTSAVGISWIFHYVSMAAEIESHFTNWMLH